MEYARRWDGDFTLEAQVIPDLSSDPIPEEKSISDKTKVVIEAHDFGGSLPLPHYGYRRPEVDYFQSNLIQHNFVLCDVVTQKHTIYFYDERSQGKGADACCSMRMWYTLQKLSTLREEGLCPKKDVALMVLMDNCSGQNKSKVTLQFFGFLSLLYKKVILFYFIRGHTKMICDRVVAHWRAAIKCLNLYCLDEIVERVATVKSLYPEHLQNTRNASPCRSGWDRVLSKFIRKMPPGYTKNYFFSIEDGVVSFKHIATTPDDASCSFTIFQDVELTRKKVCSALFGHSDLRLLEFAQLALALTTPRKLSVKKLVSIAKKYPTIPNKYLTHYPSISEEVKTIIDRDVEEKEDLQEVKQKISRKRKKKRSGKNMDKPILKKARVGRPKKAKPVAARVTQDDILRFFGK